LLPWWVEASFLLTADNYHLWLVECRTPRDTATTFNFKLLNIFLPVFELWGINRCKKFNNSTGASSSQGQAHKFRCKFYIFDRATHLHPPHPLPGSASIRNALLRLNLWRPFIRIFFFLINTNLLVISTRRQNLTELRVSPWHSPNCTLMFTTNFLGASPQVLSLIACLCVAL